MGSRKFECLVTEPCLSFFRCDAFGAVIVCYAFDKFSERNPVLLGYDVVQYHFIKPYKEGGVAVRGVPEFAYNFEGYQFWFSTKENRDLFIGDPWKYAPAWGGFCSYGSKLKEFVGYLLFVPLKGLGPQLSIPTSGCCILQLAWNYLLVGHGQRTSWVPPLDRGMVGSSKMVCLGSIFGQVTLTSS